MSWRQDPPMLQTLHMGYLSPSLPRRELWPFTRVTVHRGKGRHQILCGLLDTGSERVLIPGEPKCRSRGLQRWADQWSSGSGPSHGGPGGPHAHPAVILPLRECRIE